MGRSDLAGVSGNILAFQIALEDIQLVHVSADGGRLFAFRQAIQAKALDESVETSDLSH